MGAKMNFFDFYWWLKTFPSKLNALKESRYKKESEQANNNRNLLTKERINERNEIRQHKL